MESNELTLEEFCSSQKFIQDYEFDQNESFNRPSETNSLESLDSSVIIDSTITDSIDNNYYFFDNGFYKTCEKFYNFKRFDLVRKSNIYSFLRKNLNSITTVLQCAMNEM